MKKTSFALSIVMILSSLLIASCSKKTKHKLGLAEHMPDEYQVTTNKSLEVPPHYELKTPSTHPHKH